MHQPEHEIGILVVHGIGEQTRGQTIVDYGEPLCDWIHRWLQGLATPSTDSENRGVEVDSSSVQVIEKEQPLTTPEDSTYIDGSATLTEVSLLSSEEKDEPSTARLRLEAKKANGSIEKSSWLLAESHWAESFPPPDFVRVAVWSMKVVPWVLASFVGRQIRLTWAALRKLDHKSSLARRIALDFKLMSLVPLGLAASPFIVIAELLLLCLLLLSLLPIPALRNYLRWLHSKIAAIIGDSFIFTSSSMRCAAVVGHVVSDLKWLEQRCEKMVILAHSQGAAVAYLTLQSYLPGNLRSLVTFGSGLLKLDQLSRMNDPRNPGSETILGFLAFHACGPLLGILTVSLGLVKGPGYGAWYIVFMAALALFVALLFLVGAMIEDTGKLQAWGLSLKARGIKWCDFYASADPVPNGPLVIARGRATENQPPITMEVHNQGSAISDHTSYHSNSDEFVSAVATAISRHAQSRIPLHALQPSDERRIEFAAQKRAWRVGVLNVQRWILLVAGLALLADAELVSKIGTLTHSLWTHVSSWSGQVLNLAGSDKRPALSDFALGMACLLGILYLISRLQISLGELWHKSEANQFFDRTAHKRLPFADIPIVPMISWWFTGFLVAFGLRAYWPDIFTIPWPAKIAQYLERQGPLALLDLSILTVALAGVAIFYLMFAAPILNGNTATNGWQLVKTRLKQMLFARQAPI
jgi:hypothetical protein